MSSDDGNGRFQEALFKTQIFIRGDKPDGSARLAKLHKYQSTNLGHTALVLFDMLLCMVVAMVLAGFTESAFSIAILISFGFCSLPISCSIFCATDASELQRRSPESWM